MNVVKLFATIKAHIRTLPRPALIGDVDECATTVLDRIKIIRVFDIQGAVEAVAEVRDELEAGNMSNESRGVSTAYPAIIRDSQADEDEKDMLLDMDAVSPSTSSSGVDLPSGEGKTNAFARKEAPNAFGQGSKLLVIDDLTSLIAPALRADYVEGQALLSTILRSLRHLHTTHGASTILLNAITGLRRNPHPTNNEIHPERTVLETSRSVFASTQIKPSLGPALDQELDAHLLLHTVPATAEDAKADMVASRIEGRGLRDEQARSQVLSSVRRVHVVEVLLDRQGPRTGRIGFFGVEDNGTMSNAFTTSSNASQLKINW